jgi:hypothetical protein
MDPTPHSIPLAGHDAEVRVPVLYLDLDGTVREGKDDPLGRFVTFPNVVVFPPPLDGCVPGPAGGRIIGITNQAGAPHHDRAVMGCSKHNASATT